MLHKGTREGVGSIPDGVFGIFYWLNRSGRTATLGSAQLLKEISWGWRRPVLTVDNLPP
jgi:hypothetical protein